MLARNQSRIKRDIVARVKVGAEMGGRTYLTRFSDAMTEVETALPRACNSIVSWVSRYFLPRNT